MNHIFYVYAYANHTDSLHKKGKRAAKHTYHAENEIEALRKMKHRYNPDYFTFKVVKSRGIDETNLQLNQLKRENARRRKIELDVAEYLQKRYHNSGEMFDTKDIELITNYVIYKEGL